MATGITVNDLTQLPRSWRSGNCHICKDYVAKLEGYVTYVENYGAVIMHIDCFVAYALPKYIKAGIIV